MQLVPQQLVDGPMELKADNLPDEPSALQAEISSVQWVTAAHLISTDAMYRK